MKTKNIHFPSLQKDTLRNESTSNFLPSPAVESNLADAYLSDRIVDIVCKVQSSNLTDFPSFIVRHKFCNCLSPAKGCRSVWDPMSTCSLSSRTHRNLMATNCTTLFSCVLVERSSDTVWRDDSLLDIQHTCRQAGTQLSNTLTSASCKLSTEVDVLDI